MPTGANLSFEQLQNEDEKSNLCPSSIKGGRCVICGYDKYPGALELHHLDRLAKGFGIGDKGYTRSWERVKLEFDKCILVCANCHREVSAGITQLPEEILVEKQGEFGEVHKILI